MLRSQEIENAIRIKKQAIALLHQEYAERWSKLIKEVNILAAELRAIRKGKANDEDVTL